MVASRCSTMPACFATELDKLTRKGFRVLAVAGKQLEMAWHKVDKTDREDCEKDLEFLGLLIMQNQLKDASAKVRQSFLNQIACAKLAGFMRTLYKFICH